MKSLVAILCTALLCVSVPVSAVEVQVHYEDADNDVHKTETGVFEEDYLFLGKSLDFSGRAEDLVFLGKHLTFSGTTDLGVFALGQDLKITGASHNGIMAGAQNISIDSLIEGTCYIGCQKLRISESAVLNGTLFAGCAKLMVDGPVNGDIYVGAGEIIINHQINGNVTAYGGRMIIGERGKINGNLTYSAKEPLSDKESARVTGAVTMKEEHLFERDRDFPREIPWIIRFLIMLAFSVSFVAVGLLLLFFPAFQGLEVKRSEKGFWITALWGLIPLIMYPGVVVLSFALVVTIPFALILMLAFFPLLFLAFLNGTTLVGQYLSGKFKWNRTKRHVHFLIGAAAGLVLSSIPLVNFLAFVFISGLGWGTFLSFLFRRKLPGGEDAGDRIEGGTKA